MPLYQIQAAGGEEEEEEKFERLPVLIWPRHVIDANAPTRTLVQLEGEC